MTEVRVDSRSPRPTPTAIEVRGARVHNLRDIDVDVPLHRSVAIAGVSGSGKSSLAMGVLYAEGSRRYVEALSTYTRRRMAQAPRAAVDEVRFIPAALALRQRPGVPGVRSTFGTSTELLNVLRIMFSRLASHVCPNGHRQEPTIDVAAGLDLTCPVCGVVFAPPGAEALAFNSEGACPTCQGTGAVREVDGASLVPDPRKTVGDGAVAPWGALGLGFMPRVAAAMGVRTDVPWTELRDDERAIVLDGPEEKRHIAIPSSSGRVFEVDVTFRSARRSVQRAVDGATSEHGLARVSRFVSTQACPLCGGTRLSERARAPRIDDVGLADASAMTLEAAVAWAPSIVAHLPVDLRRMAEMITQQFVDVSVRLLQLGLGYLTLDRASASLSTGERQRVQLARAVRNRTTGILYVLDEPSVGLHPANIEGLLGVIDDLLADGNSVVFVDHDLQVLEAADHVIEIGPGSGAAGGTVVATGSVAELGASADSRIGGFLAGREPVVVRDRAEPDVVATAGAIRIETTPIHTVRALDASFPRGRLTAVTGMSGSGKTTLVLDSLVPALRAVHDGSALPAHVTSIDADGITRVDVVDATPIGTNVRSTVATYSGVMDDLRRAYGGLDAAGELGLTAADFSYNTGSLRCPRCEGTGQIVLDVQFLPDVDIDCPDCGGRRYAPTADAIRLRVADGEALPLPELLARTIDEAASLVDLPRVRRRLRTLADLGLGYLTLGEDTPALSGGEAQRLKLATELRRRQSDALFVLDEPSVGLHPSDVRVLLGVLDRLLAKGATVVVIEHDLDVIANADHVIDLGPGGGEDGGRIVVTGTPDDLAADAGSATGRFLRAHLAR